MELFNTKSTSPISGIIVVEAGEVAVLSAFNLTGSQRAVVQKVRFVPKHVPTGSACGDVLTVPAAHIAAVEDVTQCGVWALNPCQNLVVLAVPGSYRLVLDDGEAAAEVEPGVPIPIKESTAVGTAMIYADKHKLSTVGYLPKDLYLGEISPRCC